MRAVVISEFGTPSVLQWSEVPDPQLADGEVLIRVTASAVNRADLLQRQGFYPPPPGASEYPGLECSGVIEQVGSGVSGWTIGDECCALLAGGGYAELVAVPAGPVMPLPDGIDLLTASALPEVACTVWSNLMDTARLKPGETVLLHGGGSGIGTFAIQFGHAIGAHVAVTAGSTAKLERCAELGADILINYREQDFVEQIKAATDGRGADVILDNMGAEYLSRNISALASNGRIAVIGMQGGVKAELDLGKLMATRGSVAATSLRARPTQDKARICTAVVEQVWPLVADGRIKPIIDRILPMSDAAEAHQIVTDSDHVGKVLLRV
jgi:putative PIG3 family NAD(P)H quinone oxidoreductase